MEMKSRREMNPRNSFSRSDEGAAQVTINGRACRIDYAYQSGMQACQQAVPMNANPFQGGSAAADQWNLGFDNEMSGTHAGMDDLKKLVRRVFVYVVVDRNHNAARVVQYAPELYPGQVQPHPVIQEHAMAIYSQTESRWLKNPFSTPGQSEATKNSTSHVLTMLRICTGRKDYDSFAKLPVAQAAVSSRRSPYRSRGSSEPYGWANRESGFFVGPERRPREQMQYRMPE